jgi:chorismate-pyruvate lyase
MTLLAPAPVLVPIEDFADPCTRMLLTNNGSTTRLLEAALCTTVSVQVHYQFPCVAALLPASVREALGLAGESQVTVRDSTLLTHDQRPISRNHVIIVSSLSTSATSTVPGAPSAPGAPGAGGGDVLEALATGRNVPLGMALIGAAIEQHRTILAVGHHPWLDGALSRPAASKTYIITAHGQPRLHLHEVFNPDLFPAHLRDARTPEVR